jgi:uncharacterized membrane protein
MSDARSGSLQDRPANVTTAAPVRLVLLIALIANLYLIVQEGSALWIGFSEGAFKSGFWGLWLVPEAIPLFTTFVLVYVLAVLRRRR